MQNLIIGQVQSTNVASSVNPQTVQNISPVNAVALPTINTSATTGTISTPENQGLTKYDENGNIINTLVVRENLDLIKKVAISADSLDEGTNNPTTSGMTLMYIYDKIIYTKVQKTGVTTLSIIYTPKQN